MAIYDIRIRETLGDHWAVWFAPLTLARAPSGQTVLRGALPDQAALHGVLNRIAHLGLTLLSVSKVTEDVARDVDRASPGIPATDRPQSP
jgi:hypothetical protein